MSLFKMKRGQESKVSSLAKEDGSLIFSLNGANDSTLRLDQSVSGTVQRLGVAVDKAKSADGVIDYNEPTRHIKIGYAGAGLSTSNLTHIAGYTNNGTQIKDVSKDVLKNWLGASDSANKLNPTVTLTNEGSNTSGYRLIATISLNAWNNYRAVFITRSRHQGAGYLTITVGNNSNSITYDNAYSEITYWGPVGSGSVIASDSYQVRVSSDGKKAYVFWKYWDYSPTAIYVISSDFTISNGIWMTSIAEATYGKVKAYTSINNAQSLQGSSLSQILNAVGNGNAFTDLDTSINNKIKLTRANGDVVEKTINNISNASSASFASTAILAGTATNASTANYAQSAAKWTNARNISFTGDLAGSFFLDGSKDVSANIYTYNARATVNNTNNYPYHRIAKVDPVASSWVDKTTLLYISQDYNGGGYGLIRLSLRTNNASNTESSVEAKWLVRTGLSVDAIKVGHYKVAGKTYADVFYKSNGSYQSIIFRDLGSGSRGSIGRQWILINSTENNNTTSSNKNGSTECWATIETAATELHNQAYSEIISAIDIGTVAYANNSGALGGSSLSQVLTFAGGGNAFTGLETTTNNKIKLTRANGGTVEKIINNVSNATSASYASNSANLGGSPASSYLLRTGGTITGSITLPTTTHDNLVYAGVLENVNNYTPAQVSTAYKSFIGSAELKDLRWQNLIISRHRNNGGDGTGYGMYLRAPLTTKGNLIWDQQTGSSWQGERTILDSANYTGYAADRTAFSGVSISGRDITLTRANGGTVKITTQDSNTTYPVHEGTYDASFASSFRSESFGTVANGWHLAAVRTDVANVSYAPQYGSGIAWARGDTHGYLYVDYSGANAYIGGGNANRLNWQKQLAFLDSTVANATSAKNASHLGGKVASDYALKTDLSGNINALSAKRLPSYQSVSVANSFFYRYGTAGNTSDGGAWTGFPSTTLYSEASTANGFGSALFQKKVGVLHLAAGSSAHDLIFQAGGTNGGIAYVATGRNPAYILDTLNYKDKAYTFNKLTAASTFTATSGVVIDGGSY